MSETFVSGRRLLLADGERPGAIALRNGRIAEIVGLDAVPSDARVIDAGDALVMPGVVDSHVHLNEPGRTEWEGVWTGTRAAAAGGITTLVDMPLNSLPVTTTAEALERKRAAASGQCHVDLAFWGGVVPDNAHQLAPLLEAGVLGVKAFLAHSGIDDFPNVTAEDLRRAMPTLKEHGMPLLVHAELETHPPLPGADGDPRRYATFLASRPSAWEVDAVRLVIRLCRETGCAVHIVHLSAADALADIAAAKAEGLPLSVETCPHYLVFAAEDILDGATEYKCAPPIREGSNRDRLWQGLRDGVIDFVACDHSPCTPALKLPEEGDFMRAWGGVSSVQFSMPVVWTHAQARGFTQADLVPWLCGRTARLAGLDGYKGAIAPGYDADLVIWEPDATFVPTLIYHKHPVTPYSGMSLKGVVRRTLVRGEAAFEDGVFHSPRGRFLQRSSRIAPRPTTEIAP